MPLTGNGLLSLCIVNDAPFVVMLCDVLSGELKSAELSGSRRLVTLNNSKLFR